MITYKMNKRFLKLKKIHQYGSRVKLLQTNTFLYKSKNPSLGNSSSAEYGKPF